MHGRVQFFRGRGILARSRGQRRWKVTPLEKPADVVGVRDPDNGGPVPRDGEVTLLFAGGAHMVEYEFPVSL